MYTIIFWIKKYEKPMRMDVVRMRTKTDVQKIRVMACQPVSMP